MAQIDDREFLLKFLRETREFRNDGVGGRILLAVLNISIAKRLGRIGLGTIWAPMGKEREDWTEEEVKRFFGRLQSEGSAEDVAILKHLLEKRVAEGKAYLAARARKGN